MKPQTASLRRDKHTGQPNDVESATTTPSSAEPAEAIADLTPEQIRLILFALMVPNMLMPIVSAMSRVALPIIRADFQIAADLTAWIDTAYTLPFMILMPVYGRLSDGLGKRRLILTGIIIFAVGTAITVMAADLTWIMAGRVIQGLGTAGMMPLGMALITAIFPPTERGKALGTWSSVGPITGLIAPLVAGVLVAGWGWRAAFAPPLIASVIAFLVVYKIVPARLTPVMPGFVRHFDWIGVLLLATTLTSFLFYVSSRPITGVPSLRDWRLLGLFFVLLTALIIWERRQTNPFIILDLFQDSIFTRTSICASTRMFTMGALSFLTPLYLVDVHQLSPAYIGIMLMINPGAMTLMVRFGGQFSDRWGSRWPVVIGLSVQALVLLLFARLPATAPVWTAGMILALHGLGAGFILAVLHRAAMTNVASEQMGSAAGLYSMIRFSGMVVGTALAGVLLQIFLEQVNAPIAAYQMVFLLFAGLAMLGALTGLTLKEPQRTAA